MDGIETVDELIAALEDYNPDTPVRLATQRRWPFENTIAGVAVTGEDPGAVVWIAEDTRLATSAPVPVKPWGGRNDRPLQSPVGRRLSNSPGSRWPTGSN